MTKRTEILPLDDAERIRANTLAQVFAAIDVAGAPVAVVIAAHCSCIAHALLQVPKLHRFRFKRQTVAMIGFLLKRGEPATSKVTH